MLENQLYKIISHNTKPDFGIYTFEIELNTYHDIFKGHFPDFPVLPGVCIIQMIKELVEIILNNRLQLISISNIKFLKLIEPLNLTNFYIEIKLENTNNDTFKVVSFVRADEVVYSKFNGVLKKVEA